MLILLPVITCFLLFLNVRARAHNPEKLGGWRNAIVITLLLISTFVFFSTELLSLINAVTKAGIIISWGLLLLANCYFKLRTRSLLKNNSFIKYNKEGKWLLLSIGGILIVTFVTAIMAHPNNWDSMTYHLGRVMQWMQNKNVRHYPTQIDRQLTQPPLAEYYLLQIRLLSSYDPLLNLVQWMFNCGAIITVSLIAKSMQADKKTQILAAFFCATIPMGILQSTSTQNDAVVGFFIVAAILYAVRIMRTHVVQPHIWLFYLSCGLAIATKGTAFLFLFPLAIAMGVLLIMHEKQRSAVLIGFGLIITGIFFVPNAIRNQNTFGTPFGNTYDLNNTSYGVAPMLSNMAKNTAMHLRSPSAAFGNFCTQTVIGFDNLIGINTFSDKYNWAFSPKFEVGNFSTQEDAAGNFFHVLLFIACCGMFLVHRSLRTQKNLRWYVLLLIAMFCTFCYVLKWQVWNVRLHLPLFYTGSVFLALVVNASHKYWKNAVVIVFLLFSTLFLFFNQARPWLTKENIFNTSSATQYFKNNQPLQSIYADISDQLQQNNLRTVGFMSGGDSWEYPLWTMNKNISGFELRNIDPQNATTVHNQELCFLRFFPQAILTNRPVPENITGMHYRDEYYRLIWQMPPYRLYQMVPEF